LSVAVTYPRVIIPAMDPNKSLKENEEMLGFKQIIALFSLNWLGLDASGNGCCVCFGWGCGWQDRVFLYLAALLLV
jgi:hypothetical protein